MAVKVSEAGAVDDAALRRIAGDLVVAPARAVRVGATALRVGIGVALDGSEVCSHRCPPLGVVVG